jgi:peptide deformylase
MTSKQILLLGNPTLYEKSEPVGKDELNSISTLVDDLHDTLMDFRKIFGIGRAIASPQIGILKRVIYMHVDHSVVIMNPKIYDKSTELIEVWDDCMCFPDILVKVLRHKRCKIRFKNLQWQDQEMSLEDDLSELLQHEYDHLDGILAVSRAVDSRSFMLRSEKGQLDG